MAFKTKDNNSQWKLGVEIGNSFFKEREHINSKKNLQIKCLNIRN